jgi:hypothetical protein
MSDEATPSGTKPDDKKADGLDDDGVAKAYEAGKDRRYKLLFAVNGGAFIIAKLLIGTPKDPGPVVVGGLGMAYGILRTSTEE